MYSNTEQSKAQFIELPVVLRHSADIQMKKKKCCGKFRKAEKKRCKKCPGKK